MRSHYRGRFPAKARTAIGKFARVSCGSSFSRRSRTIGGKLFCRSFPHAKWKRTAQGPIHPRHRQFSLGQPSIFSVRQPCSLAARDARPASRSPPSSAVPTTPQAVQAHSIHAAALSKIRRPAVHACSAFEPRRKHESTAQISSSGTTQAV